MIIQVWAGRFKAEIGNFVTKRRSGFGQRAGGGKKRMLRTRGKMLAPNPDISPERIAWGLRFAVYVIESNHYIFREGEPHRL